MNKLFENEFTEPQKDMISICLEYVDYDADMVYVYASKEGKMISCDFFYGIGGKLYRRSEINNAKAGRYDVSDTRQIQCLRILCQDMNMVAAACEKYSQPCPTEIKIIYDVNKHAVSTDCKYESQYNLKNGIIAEDIVKEWFDSLK